jgi:serine/threonine protein kinase/TPR repeat protein
MQMPERLGKYLIRRELGRGAMGVVYEAHDPMIERAVALKVLRLDEGNAELAAELRMRFRREAQAAGRLGHPGIVAIHEYGEDAADGTAFIAMELVRGRDLKSAFDAGTRFTLEETGRLMAELLAALQHAHERGVVHRDIKPGNIILLDGGGVKVADFGIARLDTSELTQLGSVLGTVSHMAPEQLTGEAVDGRSDLYSCGVILYQLLTGERPFSGPPASLMHKVLHEQPAPPSQRAPALPLALDAVVLKAMAKEPALRHADARAFAAALRVALAGPRPGSRANQSSDEATVVLPHGTAGAVGASAAPDDATLPSPRSSSRLPPSPPACPSTSPSTSASTFPSTSPSTSAPASISTSTSDASGRRSARRVGLAVLGVLGVVAAGGAGYRLFVSDRAGQPTAVAGTSQSPTALRQTALADAVPSPVPGAPAEPPATAPALAPAPAPMPMPMAPAESTAAPMSPLTGVAPPLPPTPLPPPRMVPKAAPAPTETQPKRPAAAGLAPEPVRPARIAVPAETAPRAPVAIAAEPVKPMPVAPASPAATRVQPPAAVAAAPETPRMAAPSPSKTPPGPPSASPRIAPAPTPSPQAMPATTSSAAAPPSPRQALAGRSTRDDHPYGGADPIAPLPDAPAPAPAPRAEARIAPADAARLPRATGSAPAAAPTTPRAELDCLDDARRGNARCQVVVGNLYRAGRGVPRDPAEAASWYRKAAEQGSDAGQYELGVMHENGLGVVRNPREAVAWYRKAAAQGHARAQNMLGRASENGLAGQPNLVLASDWYRKAADQNLPIAEYNLGRLYLSGRGVFKDAVKGQALLQKAADAGEPNAMVHVAEMYARGEGKPRDRDQAMRLYREALRRAGLNDRNRDAAERALASTR